MTYGSHNLLETHQLTKRFGGLTAVSDLDLTVNQGEISSLIGPNGAGKTTVFNVVTGIYRPDNGRIVFDGSVVPPLCLIKEHIKLVIEKGDIVSIDGVK